MCYFGEHHCSYRLFRLLVLILSESRIKGTVSHEIFDSRFFFINQTHIGPRLTGQNRFAYGFVFAEIFDAKVAKNFFA
jgi:hypothetical protein